MLYYVYFLLPAVIVITSLLIYRLLRLHILFYLIYKSFIIRYKQLKYLYNEET